MRTVMNIYRLRSQAHAALIEDAKKLNSNGKFRLFPTRHYYQHNGVRVVHICIDDIHEHYIPKGDDVEIVLHCDITEDERSMISMDWII